MNKAKNSRLRVAVAIASRISSTGMLWIVGGTLLAAGATFLVSILTARGMPAEERGLYLAVFAVSQLIGLAASLGITNPILSFSMGSSSRATCYLRQQVPSLVVGSTLGAFVSFTVAYLLSRDLSEPSRVGVSVLCACLTLLNVAGLSLQIPRKALQDYQMIGTCLVISGVVPLLGFTVLSVGAMLAVFTSLFVLVLGSAVLVGYVIVRNRRGPGSEPTDPGHPLAGKGEVLKLGLKGLIAVGPSVVLVTADVLLVGWTIGLVGVSIWAVAKTVSSPVLLIEAMASNYMPPRLGAAGRAQAARIVWASAAVFGFAALAVGLLCVVLAQIFLVPVFGEQYGEAIPVSTVLVAAAVFTSLKSPRRQN